MILSEIDLKSCLKNDNLTTLEIGRLIGILKLTENSVIYKEYIKNSKCYNC